MTQEQIKEINAGLQIVKLKGDLKFYHPMGYTKPEGWTLFHPELGYLGFEDNNPYRPRGGRKALRQAMEAGGFNSFEGMFWINPMKEGK